VAARARARGGQAVGARRQRPEREPAAAVASGQRGEQIAARPAGRVLRADADACEPGASVVDDAPPQELRGPELQPQARRRRRGRVLRPDPAELQRSLRRRLVAAHCPQRVGPLPEPSEGEPPRCPADRLADRTAGFGGQQHPRAGDRSPGGRDRADDRAPLAVEPELDRRRGRRHGGELSRRKPGGLHEDAVPGGRQPLEPEVPLEICGGFDRAPAPRQREQQHARLGDRVSAAINHPALDGGRRRHSGLGGSPGGRTPAAARGRHQAEPERDQHQARRRGP
jgi:hypothetical protein